MHAHAAQASAKLVVAIGVVALILVVGGVLTYSYAGRPGSGTTTSSSAASASTSSSATITSVQSSPSLSTSSSSATNSGSLPSNQSYQFVKASVAGIGAEVAINATYRSGASVSGPANLVGIAYLADVTYLPVTGGSPIGPVCCPLVRSYSQSGFQTASTKISPVAGSQFSSILLFPSLSTNPYLVKLYIASSGGTMLSPISDVYLQVSDGNVTGGQAGTGPIFFDQDNGLVYVADSGVDSVSVINGSTSKIVATVSLPDIIGNLRFLLYDPANRQLYVGSQESPEVYAIDTSTNFIASRLVTSEPNQSLGSLVYDPVNGKIFGINFVYSGVEVINGTTDRIVANITGVHGPLSGFMDSKNNELLVSAYNGTTFAISADTDKVVGRLPANVSVFLYDPDNQRLYASSGQTIVALDASTFQQVGAPITVSGSFALYDSFNKDIYLYSGQAYDSTGGELIALSTESNGVVATIPVPGLNEGLVIEEPSFLYNGATGDIYATELTNPHNGTVGLLHISGSTNAVISQTFPSKMPLNDLALDFRDGMLYGAYGSGSSSVFCLNLSSGAVVTLEVGTSYTFELPP